MAESEEKNRNFQLILEVEEWARYTEVLRRARQHDPHLGKSKLNRILLGLAPMGKLVTKDDIKFFQGHSTEKGVMRKAGEERSSQAGTERKRVNGE